MLTAIGFCMIHNGCKLHPSINADTFNSTVSKFAQVSPDVLARTTFATNMNAKTTKLMNQESKLLKELGVRSSIIYHFKRIQDIKDALLLNIGYDQFIKSPNGDWAIENVPDFVNYSLKAFQVSRQLYERVKFKLNDPENQSKLPEDEVLTKVRGYATTQLKLMDAIKSDYATLRRKSINFVAKIKAAYRLGHHHFDLLQNEIDSVKLGISLTRESKEAEEAAKKEIEADVDRRLKDNTLLAEISLFNLFLGKSWKARVEALKKLGVLLKNELQKKTQRYIDDAAKKFKGIGKKLEKGAKAIGKEFSKDGKMAKGVKKAGNELKKAGNKIGGAFRRL